MSLIFGNIALTSKSGNTTGSLSRLKDFVSWSGCICHEINYYGFSGGYFINANHPYTSEDFYYIDNKEEALVILSGIIFNREEIKATLGITSNNVFDPELILKSFYKYGRNFANTLNGDFAFIIYLKKRSEAFLYRDHLGIRPLSFSIMADTLFFSSDIFALSRALYHEEKIDEKFLYQSLLNPIYWNYNLIPNKKVIKVLPGHFITFSEKGINNQKYWHPELIRINNKIDFITAKKKIEFLLIDAIKKRSDKRFCAAAHVSGGLDSGFIATSVKREYAQNEFYGFSWTPQKKVDQPVSYDERELVKKICQFSGIIPCFVNLTVNDYIRNLSDWRYFYIDDYQEEKVMEIAKSKGINLIFSGWGGDDFISIKHKFLISDLFFGFHWCLLLKLSSSRKPKVLLSILKRSVLYPILGIKPSLNYYTDNDFSKYLKYDLSRFCKPAVNSFYYKSRKHAHMNFINDFHLAKRTEDWSIKGFRNGIEYRYPLLDKRIVEYILSLPTKILVKDRFSRIMLRELSLGLLPDDVRWNTLKSDPVRGIIAESIMSETSRFYFDKLKIFQDNPYLHFIDFELIKKDISSYLNSSDNKEFPESLWILMYLKRVDSFTREYHK